MDNLITFNNVWEQYQVKFIINRKTIFEKIWALRGVNFEINRGECVCIIGENGSGKSTTLKLIAGMLKPDRGDVIVNGTVSALLELGAGFHPELTGRDNVYLNASLFGLPKERIDEIFCAIADFSGLGRFIDAVVKSYSQGMFVRLAFALAIHVNPDVLLIDDTLAVGDDDFQKKCIKKIFELRDAGKTIVLVSHDLNALTKLCNHGLILREGQVMQQGPVQRIISSYLQMAGSKQGIALLQQEHLRIIFNNGRLILNWKGVSITKHLGGYTSFFHEEQNHLSVDHQWVVEYVDGRKIVARGKNVHFDLEQLWTITLSEGLTLKWEIDLHAYDAAHQAVNVQTNMMISDEYREWLGLKGGGTVSDDFVHETNWLPLNEFAAHGDIMGMRGLQGRIEQIPSLLFDVSDGQPKRCIRLANTGANIKARVFQTDAIRHTHDHVFSPNSFRRIFEGVVRVFGLEDDLFDRYIHDKQRQRSIQVEECELALDQGRSALFWRGRELTGYAGLFTSFFVKNRWYDSTQAVWIIERCAQGFIVDLSWQELPLTQRWYITCQPHGRLAWRIEMHIEQPVVIAEEKVAIMLNNAYTQWETACARGALPAITGWQDIAIGDDTVDVISARSIECTDNEDMPEIHFDFSASSNTFRALIQNSAQEMNVHLLTAHRPKEYRADYSPGVHTVFVGTIAVGDRIIAEDTTHSGEVVEIVPVMKKVLLVNMPWRMGPFWGVRAGSRWPHIKEAVEGDYLPFPFYMGYAAALLQEHGFEVEVIDAIAEQMSLETFLNQVHQHAPDLIVAEISTATLKHDLAILEKMGGAYKKAICGADVIMQEKDFLATHSCIDFIFKGEYEYTLLELMQALKNRTSYGSITGLIYRNADGAVMTTHQRALCDIDALPWPLRDKFPMAKYLDAPGGMPTPSAQMWASRGCPYQCIFCAWPAIMYGGGTYRRRNIIDIVDEMEYLIHSMGFKSIYFDDDTFNIGKERMLQFCREIKRRQKEGRLKDIPWAIMARADLMDDELLTEMKSAGLFAVKYGVESAIQELVDNADKKMDVKKTEAMIRLTKAMGIKVHLTFTFGLPGETLETIEVTTKKVLKLDPDSVQFSITTPFPGTKYFNDLDAQGLITSKEWSDYDGNYKSVFHTEYLTSDDLEQAQTHAYERWAAHCSSRKQLTGIRSPLKSFFNYMRLCGVRFAVKKIGTYAMFRLRQWREDKREHKGLELIRHPLKVKVLPRGSVKLFWHGVEITKDVGLTSSVRVLNEWYDATRATWKITKQPRSIAIQLRWKDLPITQFWWIEVAHPRVITWNVDMEIEEELAIQEEKIGIMLSDRYGDWIHGAQRGIFPKIHDWEDIHLAKPEIKAIQLNDRLLRGTLPSFTFDYTRYPDQSVMQVQNTDSSRSAHLVQAQRLWGSGGRVYEPGRYTYFNAQLKLIDKDGPEKRMDTIYERSLWDVVRFAYSKHGFWGTLKRIITRLHPRKLRESYRELLGVIDGEYAYKGPDFLQIDPTNNCNNRCAGCWCHSDLLGDQKMPPEIKKLTLPYELICKVIDEASTMGTRHVYFAGGGEPFMHPRLLDIVEQVKNRDMTCSINTSFHLIDDEAVDRLIDLGVDYMTVSAWAGDAETYVKTHPDKTEQHFCRLEELLRLLNKNKRNGRPLVKLYNVISALNYDNLEAMVDFALRTQTESIEFTMIDVMPGKTEHLVPRDEQVTVIFDQLKRIQEKMVSGAYHGRLAFLGFEQFLRRVSSEHMSEAQYDTETIDALPRCYIGWVFARLLADGNINSCLKSHRIPVGNVYEESFRTIWNGLPQRVFRKHTLCFDKNDAFFSLIGNDPEVKMGCYKSCDDLDRNAQAHQRFVSLTPPEKWMLRIVAGFNRWRRSSQGDNGLKGLEEKERILQQWRRKH